MRFDVTPGSAIGVNRTNHVDGTQTCVVFDGSALGAADDVTLPEELGGNVARIVHRDLSCACGGGHVTAHLDASHNDKPIRVSECRGAFQWFTR
jgi:hypothetical protein